VHLYHSSASKSDKSTSRGRLSAPLVDPILSQNRIDPDLTPVLMLATKGDVNW